MKASQPNASFECLYCKMPLKEEFAGHLCAHCGRPQPALSTGNTEDFFEALGQPRRFATDRNSLEKTFFTLSRSLHPDRFMGNGTDIFAATERMSLINRAYNTLKDPEKKRTHLLALEGITIQDNKGKGLPTGLPLELVEAWFELQDSETNSEQLQAFETELRKFSSDEEAKITQLETQYDQSPAREILQEIAQSLQTQNYLKSLTRDLRRSKR